MSAMLTIDAEGRVTGDENRSLVAAIFADAMQRVLAFAKSADFANAVPAAFGADVTAADVEAVLANFANGALPGFRIVDDLGGAAAAYSADTDTVYLSRAFAATASAAEVQRALIEEIGHAIDARVHAADAPGDEGEIFAALVTGHELTQPELNALKLQDDHGVITIDGQPVAVEFATYGTITVDGALGDWTAADRLDSAGGGVTNYAFYGKYVAGTYIFAIQSPVAIGNNTTLWLNTDQNNATGYQVWGWAVGAEFNINVASLIPRLYTGAAGQTLVNGVTLDYAFNAARTMLEIALPASALGNTPGLNVYVDVNDSTFIPNAYANFTYSVTAPATAPPVIIGNVTLDGLMTDWTAANRLDTTGGTAGYEIYGKVTGDAYVFAIKSPVNIGPTTTAWLNTDQNAATGYQIWGFAGGAEYNVNFTAASKPQLYTGADGQTLVNADLPYFMSADKKVVEFAVPKSMIGNPNAINALFDINNTTFISNNYATIQYAIATPGTPAPTAGSVTLDGTLNDWTQAQRLDFANAVAGYEVYGKIDSGYFIFALKSPSAIGATTTAWLNTDQNAATGYQIFPAMGPQSGGAEFNINFDATGVPRLYTGADGQNAVDGATVLYGFSADKTVVEFAVLASAIGNATATNVLFDINNTAFLPASFFNQYTIAPPPPPSGDITLDGALGDWTAANRIDVAGGTAGYEVYAKAVADAWVFAIKAPVVIGNASTIWLNTDQNAQTGYQIFPPATGVPMSGGAEFNVNFDALGVPHLYTGAAAQNWLQTLNYAYSADHKIVELSIPKSALGASPIYELNALIDINNGVAGNGAFLPNDYSLIPQYEVVDQAALSAVLPVRTDVTKKVAIVYSETTAKLYFGFNPNAPGTDPNVAGTGPYNLNVNMTGYSQLFMAAQNQAAAAGIPFDIITEADLKDINKLKDYDSIIFPAFRDVKLADFNEIHNTLELAVEQYKIGLIAAGDFMTNDETGAVLPGDPYARMKEFFDLTRVNGGTADVALKANVVTHSVMEGYTAGEVIRNYLGTGWQTFADATPGVGPAQTVLDIQTVGGVNYSAVVASTTGGRNVHFATESFLGDNNQLQKAIQWSVQGDGVKVGLQMSRFASIFAGRNDMDQAQMLDDVRPLDEEDQPIPGGGIYDKLLPIVNAWKAAYNFVSSYYVDVGDHPELNEQTIWSHSLPYYLQLLANGNELGSHSLTHLAHMATGEDTNYLMSGTGAGTFDYEFRLSKEQIEANVRTVLADWRMTGAAVPGMPERLPASLAMLAYYDYLSGGYAAVGSGYPGAIGYILPGIDKIYIAPNMKFDFTLVEFQKMSPAAALAEWKLEFDGLAAHSDLPVIVWPWHDYAAAQWVTPGDTGPSPYNAAMFNDFLAYVYGKGTEFVTLEDLARRMKSMEQAKISYTINGNVVTATVQSTDAGKFSIDLDSLGAQKIVSVAGWYAYDEDSVFLPRNGGTYNITLGAAPAEISHIIELPMRAELVSLSGDGRNLTFTVVGEGKMKIDLQTPGATQAVVSGATKVSQVGDILTLDLGAYGTKTVTVALGPATGAPPVITSNGGGATAAINFAENGVGNVATVTATNSAGGALTYSIAGGADADKFTINASTGALTFRASPDFETPADAGLNNVYDVVVRVTNALSLFDEQAIAVTVTNVAGVTFNGGTGNDTWNGTAEDDTANGNNGNDTLNGNAGNDIINGNAGTDTINGGAGNDVINGGAGRDVMTGGAGADRFVFSSAADAGNTAAARDVINDFVSGEDKIDLSAIDANSGVTGVQQFVFLPTAGAVFSAPGQLRFYYTGTGTAERTIIEGNITGTTGSEFMIELVGRINLVASDFIGAIIVSGPVAPIISSNGGGATAAVSAPENGTAVTTVTAYDLNGDIPTYSIIGGDDAAKFTINPTTGVLTFIAAPDFEAPGDVGANNVYDVIVQASDGALTASQAIAVTVTNVVGATQNGTAAANTMTGTPEDETINGAGGNDIINGNGGNDTLNGGAGSDTIHGNDGDDIINGDAAADTLFGDAGNDTLNGGAGADILDGGTGNDILNGGAGNDTMTGGAGADTFLFSATVSEIGNGTTAGSRDTITDFEVGIDKIDLSLIDANTSTTGNQAFTFLAAQGAAFTAAGQLRFVHQQIGGVWHTIVEGNVTGTTGSEFRIDLVGQLNLTAADFIL